MWRTCAAALIAAAAGPHLALAQQGTAEFYAGKQVKMICSSDVGGGYDVYSRLFARHLGKHTPGRPLVVSTNMPGAAGVTAAGYFAHSAARNGTELLMVVQTLPMVQVTQAGKARFDLAAFNWIGNMDESANVFVASRESGVKTIEDVLTRELVVGSTSPNAIGGILPEVANRILGTKFKIIHGYKSGEAIEIAMQRGEVNGRAGASWSAMKALRGSSLRTEEINVLLQAGNRKEPDLPDVPLLTDLARSETERAALAFYSGMTALARAIATTPETPADRVAALRKAFDDALADPDLIADAQKSNLEIRPLSGATLQSLVERMVRTDRALISP
jgi:tripartite-type tricarboxylate transporter receptor subunit TctC